MLRAISVALPVPALKQVFGKIVILRGRCAKNGKTAMLSALADNIFCSWGLLEHNAGYLELILVPLLAISGPSWGRLGRSEGHLGPLLRPIGAILGTSRSRLSSSWALEELHLIICSALEAYWGTALGMLSSSWFLHWPSGASGAILAGLRAILG